MYNKRRKRKSLSDLLPQLHHLHHIQGGLDVTFKVGQKVVYPNHGVSLVEKIEPGHIDGVEQLYFHLRLLANNSKVMVPKTNIELVGLRPLSATREVRAHFDIL